MLVAALSLGPVLVRALCLLLLHERGHRGVSQCRDRAPRGVESQKYPPSVHREEHLCLNRSGVLPADVP